MNYDQRYRVFNKCKYDIGVQTLNGLHMNIRAGSFQMLTANDILYIESICVHRKFFSEKMLVAVDETGKELELSTLGIVKDESIPVHMTDIEISAMLKKTAKQIEAWLENIDDPAELHAIFEVAKKADISSAKMKILHDKMPEKEWFEN